MPTGYTSDIYDGKNVSAKEFIIKCAKAFGANIALRDEGMDVEIPIYEPSDYHIKQIEKTKENIKKLANMTDEEIQNEIEAAYNKKIEDNEKAVNRARVLENRYLLVLNDVQKWNPPTEDHVKLKEYAIDQLTQSIKHDCSTSYITEPVKETVNEYRISRLKYENENLEYHTKSYENEVQRTNEKNEWNRKLKESFE